MLFKVRLCSSYIFADITIVGNLINAYVFSVEVLLRIGLFIFISVMGWTFQTLEDSSSLTGLLRNDEWSRHPESEEKKHVLPSPNQLTNKLNRLL